MKSSRTTALLAVAILISACGGNQACTEPEPYQAAVEGKRIEVPEGLSALSESAELKIPDASPQPAPAEGSPCLELPPAYKNPDK
jgi:uncharacterized lipoprotein